MEKRFILVVEDDAITAGKIISSLRKNDLSNLWTLKKSEILHLAANQKCDAVILDLGLPGIDGLELLKSIRNLSEVPILVITGRVGLSDRILGLSQGADDYITKPFSVDELIARLYAVLRRSQKTNAPTKKRTYIKIGNGNINLLTRELTGLSERRLLTETEIEILKLFIDNNKYLNREAAYVKIFLRQWSGTDRSLDVHVANLRKKLAQCFGDDVKITSVHRKGYNFWGDLFFGD